MQQKIKELKEMQNELKKNYRYYIMKEDYNSLKNIASQLYRNDFTIKVLEGLLNDSGSDCK